MMKGLEQNSYELWLKDPGKKEGDIIDLHNYLKQGCNKEGVSLLPQVTSDRIRRSGLKLCQRKFRLVIGKQIFSKWVVKLWSRQPREVVESLSLDVLKNHADMALDLDY